MAKTTPTSIRFDSDKLEFVKNKEGLKTPQKVVDFFLDAYWWQNKLQESPKSPSTIIPPIPTVMPSNEPKISVYDAYRADILNTTYSGDLQQVMKEIEGNPDLGAVNKAKLRAIANDHRTNFTN